MHDLPEPLEYFPVPPADLTSVAGWDMTPEYSPQGFWSSSIPHTEFAAPHTEFALPHTEFAVPHAEFALPHSEFMTLDRPLGHCGEFTEFGLPGTNGCALESHGEFDEAPPAARRGVFSDADIASDAATRPLNVIHVGQYLYRAGIESWLKSLVSGVDRRQLRFLRCVVTSP